MTKQDAVSLFKTQSAWADAIGVTRGRISQIPDGPLPDVYIDRTIGAATRLGITIPKKILKECCKQGEACA